jgi:uncharacterized protein
MRRHSKAAASIRHALILLTITVYMHATYDDCVVTACQLCLRNAFVFNTPSSFRFLNALESINVDIYQTVVVPSQGNGFILNNVELRRRSNTFPARQRRINLPLYMMSNNDNKMNATGTSAVPANADGINTRESAGNQTGFDSVSFFEELQRSNAINDNETQRTQEENSMSVAMIATIGFYKKIISPLLPPACRFVPTCSSYGVQAIQDFGPTKGCILIAWRILRCSPIGGKGYDPPRWPPVFYTYSSY